MRIDKFLKTARVLKKRSVSKELALQQRVFINDRKAKPASIVHENDEVLILFGNRSLTIRVLKIQKQASKSDATEMYEIVDESYIENKAEEV